MKIVDAAATEKAPADRFTGDAWLDVIVRGEAPSRIRVSVVRFAPGARNGWHSHAVGQTLHCTDGLGLVVSRDGTVAHLRAGDTVYTSPGEEHWHGATFTNMMCHLAMLEEAPDGASTTWREPVSDEEYAAAHRA